jgi:preprotein translocase subunit SecE
MQFKNNLLVQMIFSVTEMVLIMAVVLACIDDRFIFVLV